MDEIDRGQVSANAAQVYETFFVPALFGEWAEPVLDRAAVQPGERLLDVACGTGVLARAALARVTPGGAVSGIDRNEGMLAVAREQAPGVDWRLGLAESLPFESGSFERVVSQFGLMFFEDRTAAMREMRRVLSPSGRMVVAVWDRLENTPGYLAMVGLLQRLFGDAVAEALRAPFCLGEQDVLRSLLDDAGLAGAQIETRVGSARFPSLDDWVRTDVKGWTLATMIDDDQYRALQEAAPEALSAFVLGDGSVAFPSPAHLVSFGGD